MTPTDIRDTIRRDQLASAQEAFWFAKDEVDYAEEHDLPPHYTELDDAWARVAYWSNAHLDNAPEGVVR